MARSRKDDNQEDTFVVTIPNVDAATAIYLLESYKGATATEGGGAA